MRYIFVCSSSIGVGIEQNTLLKLVPGAPIWTLPYSVKPGR